MSDKESQDTIMNAYNLLTEQIKENEEYRISKEGISDLINRKKQISKIESALKNSEKISSEKVKIGLADFRNEIKQLEGSDYYFRVDDGFRTYKIKKSTIERKGRDVTVYLLKKYRDSVNIAYHEIENDKMISKEALNRKKSIYDRLNINLTRNIDLLNNDLSYKHDDYFNNKIFDEAYPIFVSVSFSSIKIYH